jgi:hypothetical protein
VARLPVIAVLLALAPRARAVAQAAMPDSVFADLAGHLEGQSRIRVSLWGGQPAPLVLFGPRLVGSTIRFDRYASGGWILDTTVGQHAIPMAEIRRIQVRGPAFAKGAIVGFFAGALAIGAVNLAGKYQIERGETLWFVLLFGTAGAAVGAPMGGLFHEWRTVYPPGPR